MRALAFFDGASQSVLYDNITFAVARILGDGKRQRMRVLGELQLHYLLTDRFCRPGSGKVLGLGDYARPNFLVAVGVS